jgi:hypothetical protein
VEFCIQNGVNFIDVFAKNFLNLTFAVPLVESKQIFTQAFCLQILEINKIIDKIKSRKNQNTILLILDFI